MSIQPFIGSWKLVSLSLTSSGDSGNGASKELPQKEASGRFVVAPSGYLACIIPSLEAPPALDDAPLVLPRSVAYSGRIHIYDEGGEQRLRTDVDVASIPDWIGRPQVRRWTTTEENGKTLLTLCPLQQLIAGNGNVAMNFVWEKM
ncbi:hypothetical protein BJY01DRAFT_253420 [Aspergillus pseudoustus]|uniref:Lipocalin-like domain-containing protein n=1 Tax=Aspergillus pseudoustus TaxID=1810923 RepID=A0ABR4J3D6_9EURO